MRQSLHGACFDALGLDAEKLEVAAKIEDVKLGFVESQAEQIGAQARAASYHLPELGFAANRLEDHQIQNVGHVDSRIQHIDRNRDLRHFVSIRKIVNQRLRIVDGVVDDATKMSGFFGIIDVETLDDELGVFVIARENDGFAQAVATRDARAFGHHFFQNFVDGVGIEKPGVDGVGRDFIGRAVFAPFFFVPLRAFVLSQVIVMNALNRELEIAAMQTRRTQKAILDGLHQFIRIGGRAVFEVEKPVGVVVDFIARRRG